MKRRTCLLAVSTLLLAGCVSGARQFAKSDIDRIADLRRREIAASLQRLAEKLYRRNPLSQTVADQTQRTVVKVVQSITTAIFLPI